MALAFTNGTITTTASEQNLFDITADNNYATYIFAHNMVAADEVEIKVYTRDENGTPTMRVYRTKKLKDAQSDPTIFIPFLPTKQYKVTIKRLAGTDRAFTWLRVTQ